MDINSFIKDDKLQIPEDKIDSIYIWTKITRTQEVLMSSEVYYKWMKKSFDTDTEKVVNVVHERYSIVNRNHYQLSDFITFNANRSSIFSGKRRCFVHCSNMELLISLACYIAHTMNLYVPVEAELFRMISDRVSEPEMIKRWLESDLLMLSANGLLPDHKYKTSTLNMLFIDRCKDAYCTLVHTFNAKEFLFDNNDHLIETAKLRGVQDLNPLVKPWKDRRTYDYRKLMSTWYSMLANTDCLVYSEKEPKDRMRQREI